MNLSESLGFLLRKADSHVQDAGEYIESASLNTILHGNHRNFRDALEVLAASGAVTKTGRIAFNRKGATYRALQEAMDASLKEREKFSAQYHPHQGTPTEIMKANAKSRAAAIADHFKQTFIPQA